MMREFRENPGIGGRSLRVDSIRSFVVAKHCIEQFHRQPDDVRFASLDDVNPSLTVLQAERAGFSFPEPRIEVFLDRFVGNVVHDESRPRDADVGLATDGP